MTQSTPDNVTGDRLDEGASELELNDADILDAMQNIPGYLDISTEDFRAIYHLAYQHALERLYVGVTAAGLMRSVIKPLQPNATLDMAAKSLADSGYKGLPVVDAEGRVVGMLTETDFLRHMHAENFSELLSRMLESSAAFNHTLHETAVSAAMTQPAVTISHGAGFPEMLAAFKRHGGRSMPVVGEDGRLLGLLQRKDFLKRIR